MATSRAAHATGRLLEGADGWTPAALPAAALAAMQRAIVGFRLRVTRWEVKEKLSQNRKPEDVAAVIAALQAGDGEQRQLAARMAERQ
jgi:transcriptional regulator